MTDQAEVLAALRAIGRALIAHCHEADRPGSDDFRIERRTCAACRVLEAALGLDEEPAQGPR